MDKITVNDTSNIFQVLVEENNQAKDISTATAMAIILIAPDGTVSADKTASFTTDGTDGLVEYERQAGDIQVTGIWAYRAKVTMPGSKIFYTNNPQFIEVVD